MSIIELIGTELTGKSSSSVSTEDALKGKKVVGLYFSAHWCPPCRGFTPKLAEFYNTHSASKNFEIIFISSDQDEKSFNDYFNEMPWLALPFKKQDVKNMVSQAFQVRGIPTLVFLDAETGDVLCTEGREKVCNDFSASGFPWA